MLIVGSILRFDADQYSWRSQSSQFLRRRQMMIGSNLFHMGVLVLFVGHFIGLLTPIWVFEVFGVPHMLKQLTAMAIGGLAGLAALVGASLLLHRRLFDPRIRRSSSIGDIAVLVLLWLQLVLGVGTIWWSAQHLDGSEMVQLMGWANAIVLFDATAPGMIEEVSWIFKLHIVLGLTLFLITPSRGWSISGACRFGSSSAPAIRSCARAIPSAKAATSRPAPRARQAGRPWPGRHPKAEDQAHEQT